MKTCSKCEGEGLLFDTPGEPYCPACAGTGDVNDDGSAPCALSHGEPFPGERRGFRTGDTVKLKHRDGFCVGTISEETRYTPTDGKGPVFHFCGLERSDVASCTVRPHEIERCDKWGLRLIDRAVLGEEPAR